MNTLMPPSKGNKSSSIASSDYLHTDQTVRYSNYSRGLFGLNSFLSAVVVLFFQLQTPQPNTQYTLLLPSMLPDMA